MLKLDLWRRHDSQGGAVTKQKPPPLLAEVFGGFWVFLARGPGLYQKYFFEKILRCVSARRELMLLSSASARLSSLMLAGSVCMRPCT